MNTDRSPSRQAGDELVVAQAQRQVQTFFDELKNGTRNYRTIASLDAQIAQEYRGRCILELLQNAHDAIAHADSDDAKRISFVLSIAPEPVLLVGNSGRPFRKEDFDGICQLAQSPKDPNVSVGNKGLGFRSVLEVSSCPEIWSIAPAGSDTCFVFRFDPDVSGQVAIAAQAIEQQGIDTRSLFDPARPLVDWSIKQLNTYREHMSDAGIDAICEARKFLSPYLFPLPIEGMPPPEVDELLRDRHATVVRLPLNGGKAGASGEAAQSVKDQLEQLDARSTLFLHHLDKLVIDINGERRMLERTVDSDAAIADHPRTRRQRVRINSSPTPNGPVIRQFHVWTRVLGGNDEPEQTERIGAVVEHLPNRWPQVRRVTVGIAVEDASDAEDGVFVIFLPTETTTGTGAHVNAPFYGSLDRRQIDFDEPYNALLLNYVLDLCLDAVTGLVAGQPAAWRARAVIDLLSSTATVGGEDWSFIIRLRDLASRRGKALGDQTLILCDDGWHLPGEARVMPNVQDEDPIGAERWREHAEFAVVSNELSGRLDTTRKLLTDLDGSPEPTHHEWRSTIERMATHVSNDVVDVTWDDFLISVLAFLPVALRSEPRFGAPDPLADAKFLPMQDGHPIAASDTAKLFFQPVRGADDAADLVGEVPRVLRPHVAFLHKDVRTQEGPQRRNTIVQKFLDGRFARGFRREDVLRLVIVPALPKLPVPYDSPEAKDCAEILAWTLKLLGDDESDALLPLIRRLPVASHGGWRAMSTAVFGSGWQGRLGDRVRALASELPDEAAKQLHRTALVPPNDSRWGIVVEDRGELFTRAGVFDGLRLQPSRPTKFKVSQYSPPLPDKLPAATPRTAWDDWRNAVRAEAEPPYLGLFDYELSGVQLLPVIHHLAKLSSSGRKALSDLLFDSLAQWDAGWEAATISKISGTGWRTHVTSPLKYWLTTLPWLMDGPDAEPLGRRWLVPESLLQGQRERYAHLDPLSLELARRLSAEPRLQLTLAELGLNVYPTEEARTGPELLDALAAAWSGGRVPAGRFDVFLGQVREAWQHLDPDKGLPDTFLVRSGQRKFSTREGSELADAFLPDDRDRARSLQEYGKPVLEMRPPDARRKADALLAVTKVQRASMLNEQFLIDGDHWTGLVDGIPPLDESRYATWLPVTLLTVLAHGGANPTGAATTAWREAAERLRRSYVLECENIAVELADGDRLVAAREPEAQWLPGNVLAVRRTVKASHGDIAPAVQAMLDRQDLLKDLRLVLRALAGYEQPTREQIEVALDQAEIDTQTFADIHNRWAGSISLVVDRIRPVLALLGIRRDGFEAATDIEHLTEWLTFNLPHWPAPDVLLAARRSRDDRAMGEATWRTLGDVAQLPAWNDALATLGNRYVPVENRRVGEQTQAHLEEAKPLLRAFARYVAVEVGHPELFHRIEEVSQALEADADWSTRWWEVPFSPVLDALRAGYDGIPGIGCHLEVIEGARTIDDLRAAFQRRCVRIDPDPYETAARNQERLSDVLVQLHDLHRTWVEFRAPTATRRSPPTPPASRLDTATYLRLWSEGELIEQSLLAIEDEEFVSACHDCASLEAIRQQLGLTPEATDARRHERHQREQEAERRRRTFDVAGTPFEVGTTSYSALFERLGRLAAPEGPRASRDEFTPLAKARPSGGGSGAGSKAGSRTLSRRSTADLRDLAGIVGEIHAYRFLRTEFGSDVVTRDTWVSENRLKVLPRVKGEPDKTSDSHGFDFQFRHGRKKWHVEVKATIADDPQFELGISEIRAANRLARERGGRWRILRVRNVLSGRPEFDWLPNLFEKGFRKHFRLYRGGMLVSYTPKREAQEVASEP